MAVDSKCPVQAEIGLGSNAGDRLAGVSPAQTGIGLQSGFDLRCLLAPGLRPEKVPHFTGRPSSGRLSLSGRQGASFARSGSVFLSCLVSEFSS